MSASTEGSKEKRQPSITPRKFTRFFTPRSHGPSAVGSSRRTLFDVTVAANNRNGSLSSPIRPLYSTGTEENCPTFTREMKRRKLLHSPPTTPELIVTEKGCLNDDPFISHAEEIPQDYYSPRSFITEFSESPTSEPSAHPDFSSDIPRRPVSEEDAAGHHLLPIRYSGSRGLAGKLLRSRLGLTDSRRRSESSPISSWQDETASFYSRPEDTHFCHSLEGADRCIPFCVASCNTNTLLAVGDEEGRIRILESAKHGKPAFKDIYLSFRPHSNAIIDMCFSQDDSLLATASGDQTSRVIDMATQTTISVLAHHTASLKQVRFQPGSANNSVIATSSRDGSVQIWDLRCKGMEPTQSFHVPLDPTDNYSEIETSTKINYGCVVSSIYQAHRSAPSSRHLTSLASNDGPTRGEIPGRAGDVSVTAINFLPVGQEHLLLTASESNATVKLWDIRSLHKIRQSHPTPLSSTAQPRTHSKWRHFGISSLNISGDGSRLYSLCKDNTIYAYSMAHLVLGRAPELSASRRPRRYQTAEAREGLGPLYGFRHPKLHVTSFYVKSALREIKNGKTEMLAVGSSDGCMILFPTDERYHRGQETNSSIVETYDDFNKSDQQQSQTRVSARDTLGDPRVSEDIPIYQHGTPLVRGHDREVGALTWTSEGELVTVGDDFLVRCWRNGDHARDLRTGGEEGGRRWGSGWAAVSASYDSDD